MLPRLVKRYSNVAQERHSACARETVLVGPSARHATNMTGCATSTNIWLAASAAHFSGHSHISSLLACREV